MPDSKLEHVEYTDAWAQRLDAAQRVLFMLYKFGSPILVMIFLGWIFFVLINRDDELIRQIYVDNQEQTKEDRDQTKLLQAIAAENKEQSSRETERAKMLKSFIQEASDVESAIRDLTKAIHEVAKRER